MKQEKMRKVPLFLICFLLGSACFAGDEDEVKYTDVFSAQYDRRGTWEFQNWGFSLSRYYFIDAIDEKYFLFPGLGVRAKIGRHQKIELLSKLAWAGLLGVSPGAYLDESGIGYTASVWAGLEFIGAEYSFYSQGNDTSNEFSVYIAIQFAALRNGKYGFENWFFIPWSWKLF